MNYLPQIILFALIVLPLQSQAADGSGSYTFEMQAPTKQKNSIIATTNSDRKVILSYNGIWTYKPAAVVIPADTSATTENGRLVILNANDTWSFADGSPLPSISDANDVQIDTLGASSTQGSSNNGSMESSVRSGGNPIILGALDKSLIDKVIKRNQSKISYCYQKELQVDPSLSGKIIVKFVIAANGSVSKASIKSSTMGSADVESCITDKFKTFQFPEPKGGGIVIVSYPFIFSS
jgi:hypothetical protein